MWKRNTQKKRCPCDHRGRHWSNAFTNLRNTQSHQKLETRNEVSFRASGESKTQLTPGIWTSAISKCYRMNFWGVFFFFFGHAMQHMGMSIRDQTCTPCTEAWTLNHWTAKGSSHFCCFQCTSFVAICYGSPRKLHTGSVWSDVG